MAQTAKTGEPLLIPSPNILKKALVESADRARRMAKAFGLKVPEAPGKTTGRKAA